VSDYFPSEDVNKVMRDLRAASRSSDALPDDHLDDDQIAAMIAGIEPGEKPLTIEHLSRCVECRDRLTAVANLLDDPQVAAAMPRTDTVRKRILSPARWASIAALAAAAAVTIVLVRPAETELRREGTLTTTAAPKVLSSAILTSATDSLRWTHIPGADLYRVQVWNHEGTVVWSADTRDSVIAPPASILRDGASYLWEVKARTGWDRWVSSDFEELSVRLRSQRQ